MQNFSKTPILYKEYTQAGIGNNRMFGVLLCMKQILKNDKHWNLYVDQIELLIDKYEKVDVKTMGFPDDWKNWWNRNRCNRRVYNGKHSRYRDSTSGRCTYF